MELWAFLLCARLELQDWNCLNEPRLRFVNGAWLVLAAGKSCLRAREKLERREKEGIRDFDIVGPIASQSMGCRCWSSKKLHLGLIL